MTDFDAIAQGLTQAVPFAGYLGLEISSVGEGEAKVRLPERDELTNHVGSQHAGALFTVAEAASGAAFVGAFAERLGEVTPLARNAEISYVKIAKGPIDAAATLAIDKAEALATLEADGKVVFPCEIALTDSQGQLVATATVHWHVRLNQPLASDASDASGQAGRVAE
jgi:uncharacterized protein (TIGR00369 family)